MWIRRSLLVAILTAGLCLPAAADEGMWMPHQMKDLGLKTLGLRMDPDDLFRADGTGLMSAIVHLGGGTAEFISAQGLLLTNHHVAFGALQRASNSENDYIQHGFLANARTEEIPAPGYHADVLLGYEEVTDRVRKVLKSGMNPRERFDALQAIEKKLIAEAEEEGPDIRASLASMYAGNQYYLFRFKRLKDLRLVYAPPRDLGNFGGDIDNWMWPRHTCDFTFLRAYVGPDGTGVEHAPGNVPYQPAVHLKLSLDGFKEGDFSFVMGYPGRTYRNTTVVELTADIEDMTENILVRRDLIDFLEKAGEGRRDIQIKYAGIIKGLNNGLKNYQGKLEGFRRVDLLRKKQAEETRFQEWADRSPQRRKTYGTALADIQDFMDDYIEHSRRTAMFNRLVSSTYSSALLDQAHTITRAAAERQNPDMERDPAYQERNLDDIRLRMELAERGYHLATDRSLLKHRIRSMLLRPRALIPSALHPLIGENGDANVNAYVDGLYEGTGLADPSLRLAMLDMTPDELSDRKDPFLELAADLESEMRELREQGEVLDRRLTDLKQIYLAGLLEHKDGRLAPDANSTIRFTYGFFRGYQPRDAVWYDFQTSLGGVLEKETGEFPFSVPDKLKTLSEARDFGRYADPRLKDIPTCFLNSTSVTGGNSGSPTLNADGEQIGIIFDMTYESVTADYYIIPELQRTISVDIRYVLFITEKFGGATHIIEEIGL